MHVELLHKDHFISNYKIFRPHGQLSRYVECFWETDFTDVFKHQPGGFCNVFLPNVGYTYLIHLGTPFSLELNGSSFSIKTDAFVPRNHAAIVRHRLGNHVFGIKFRVSPIYLLRDVNFFEYRNFIFPLTYLFDDIIIKEVKSATSFQQRVEIVCSYYNRIIKAKKETAAVRLVGNILYGWQNESNFDGSIKQVGVAHKVNTRVLRGYFETTIGISPKQAFQIVRMRKAIERLLMDPASFDLSSFSYHNKSHFLRHLKAFLADSRVDPSLISNMLP